MIYQCFFRPEQTARLFASPAYRGFGLEPEVNPDIFRNCPELESESNRLNLVEHAAMLHLWRNPRAESHDWIGFTSYRQTDKTPFYFEDIEEIRSGLDRADVLSWGFASVSHSKIHDLTGAAAQLEFRIPGAFTYLKSKLDDFGIDVPPRFLTDPAVLFANYWVMSGDHFRDFMRFMEPILLSCLEDWGKCDFLNSHPKAIGHVLERLIIIWYMRRNARVLELSELFAAKRPALARPVLHPEK